MKRKHSIPAFFFLNHPDRDSREFAALARKEGYDRILLLHRENPFVANLHPIQAESERSIWAVYLMDFRRPATHSSDAWNCEEAAKTLDCDKYTRHYKADKVLYSGNGLPGKNGKGNP